MNTVCVTVLTTIFVVPSATMVLVVLPMFVICPGVSSARQPYALAYCQSFFRRGQNGLKIWRRFFARDDRNFDFFESSRLEPLLQIALRKSKPMITVQLARFLKLMFEQIQNHELPPRFQNA